MQYATSRPLPWQRLTDYLLRAVGSSYVYTGIDGDLRSVTATVSGSGGNYISGSGIVSDISGSSSSISISGSSSIGKSDKDLDNQSTGALNHTLQFQQHNTPFNCSARHEDKGLGQQKDKGLDKQEDKGSDDYYDNPPAWSRDELEALPYSINDLLIILIEVFA